MINIENKKINPIIIVGILVAIVLLAGGFVLLRANKQASQSEETQENLTNTQEPTDVSSPPIESPIESPVETTSPVPVTGKVKEFTVDGSNFKFSPSQITVNKGDTVKITFKDDDGTHNLTIDGYNVSTQTIQSGTEDSVQFVADKAGTFNFFCSVGKHKDLGMTGTLTVK